jgi:hypothetical protein
MATGESEAAHGAVKVQRLANTTVRKDDKAHRLHFCSGF